MDDHREPETGDIEVRNPNGRTYPARKTTGDPDQIIRENLAAGIEPGPDTIIPAGRGERFDHDLTIWAIVNLPRPDAAESRRRILRRRTVARFPQHCVGARRHRRQPSLASRRQLRGGPSIARSGKSAAPAASLSRIRKSIVLTDPGTPHASCKPYASPRVTGWGLPATNRRPHNAAIT